ncbi:MAG: DUF4383 domain-containing protein [Anaerolineae bacterium]
MNTLGIKLSQIFAAAFLLAAVIGFIPNPVVGSHGLFLTNAAHNLVHMATAIGFFIVARMGNQPSINFMLGFGVVYLLVGMAGFLVTGKGSTGMLLGLIHINSLDNFLHLGLGTAILAGGLCAHGAIHGACANQGANTTT